MSVKLYKASEQEKLQVSLVQLGDKVMIYLVDPKTGTNVYSIADISAAGISFHGSISGGNVSRVPFSLTPSGQIVRTN